MVPENGANWGTGAVHPHGPPVPQADATGMVVLWPTSSPVSSWNVPGPEAVLAICLAWGEDGAVSAKRSAAAWNASRVEGSCKSSRWRVGQRCRSGLDWTHLGAEVNGIPTEWEPGGGYWPTGL